MEKKNFYVQLSGGNCTIVKATEMSKAVDYSVRTFGSLMEPRVREATGSEVNWVKSFGGRIHETS